MPLIDLDRPLYMRRDRFFVDNQDRTVNSKEFYDIEVDLDKRYENVQSIEVTDYFFSQDMTPVFIERTETAPGNNVIDVYMTYTGGPQTLSYTIEFDVEKKYTTIQAVHTDLETLLNTGMDAQSDAFFNTTNIQWDLVSGTSASTGIRAVSGTLQFDLIGAEEGNIFGYFLFGTGPNRGNSPERILGFEEKRDTVVVDVLPPPLQNLALTYAPRSSRLGYLRPYRYVDLFIKEAEASFLRDVPVARANLTSFSYRFSQMTTPRPRLYTNPLHYADKLHLTLRLEDDRVPKNLSTQGWDAVLDIIQLSNETTIPQWVQQRLQYP